MVQIISYVVTVLLYSIQQPLTNLYLLINHSIIALSLVYALYKVWVRYENGKRTLILTVIAVFSIIFNIFVIVSNIFLGGIITIVLSFGLIYLFSYIIENKII